MPTERAAAMKQLLDALPPEIRDIAGVTALYLLEPAAPGRGVGAVRRACGRSPSCGPACGASGSDGRRRSTPMPAAILGRPRRRVLAKATSRRSGRSGRSRARRSSGAAWFAPTGGPDRGRRPAPADWRTAARRWAGSSPRASGGRGRTTTGTAVEIDGLPLRGAFDLITALERLLAADCADLQARPARRRPRGQPRAGRPGAGGDSGRDGRARGRVRRAPGRRRARRGRRGAPRDPARRAGLRRAGHQGARRLHPGLRRSGPSAGSTARSRRASFSGFANKSHDGFVGHSVVGHWVNLGAGTTTSNLKNTYGPVRLEVDGDGSRPAASTSERCSATTPRPPSGRCWPPAPWSAPAPTCSGRRHRRSTCRRSPGDRSGGERMTEDGFLRDRRAGHEPPERGAVGRAARVAAADVCERGTTG